MKFAHESLSADGRMERGLVEAASESDARRSLQRQGFTVLELYAREHAAGRGRISRGDVLLVFTELSTLLHSGVGIAEAVASIAASHEKEAMRGALERLRQTIGQGRSFADSLAGCGIELPAYFLQLAAAGELTGRLASSLEEAVEQLRYELELNSEIRSALVYPAVLVASGLIAVGVMFSFVVPRFAGLLKDAEQLPWLSWVVLSTGKFASENFALVCLLALALCGALAYPLRNASVREALYERMAGWPVIGAWLSDAEIGRWATLAGALLAQGVPMLDSLALASRGMRIAGRRRRLEAAARAVKGGTALSRALQEQSALNATAYNLLRTGERAGKLPEMLKSLGKLHGSSARTRMKRVLLLVEPVAILLIGAAIGVIVLGIILAITSLTDLPV